MIKQYRLAKNLSQEELAEEIGISQAQISRIEKLSEKIGISWRQLQRLEHNEENTRISTFKKIIKTLDVPDDEILKFIKK